MYTFVKLPVKQDMYFLGLILTTLNILVYNLAYLSNNVLYIWVRILNDVQLAIFRP